MADITSNTAAATTSPESNPFLDREPGSRITAPFVGATLAQTPKPASNDLKQNVYLDLAVGLTAAVGHALLGLSNELAFRDRIYPGNIGEVRARLASALASIEEVATAAADDDSGLLLDGADAYAAAARLTIAKGN